MAHWSFYLHTGGSPIQGHEWTDNEDGTFTAAKRDRFQFSDLDLYLMGLIPPDQVEPWFLIENPRDCPDSTRDGGECAEPGSHLFEADQYRVTGERRDITIDDVIRAEGARRPAFPNAPDTYDVSFILVKRPDETLGEDELDAIDAMIDRSIVMWEEQTRGLGDIVNRTARNPEPPGTTGGTGGSTGDGDGDSEGGTTGGLGTTGGPETGPSTGSSGTDGPTATTESGGSETAGSETGSAADPSAGGCGCRARPVSSAFWCGAVLAVGLGRRRRS